MGKVSHGISRYFKLIISEKNDYKINSVDILFYHNIEIIPIVQYLYFPARNFSQGIFPSLPDGIFSTVKMLWVFQKQFQLHKFHVIMFRTVLFVFCCICSSIIYQINHLDDALQTELRKRTAEKG